MTLAQFHRLQEAADAIIVQPAASALQGKVVRLSQVIAERRNRRPSRKLLQGLVALRTAGKRN